MAKLTIGLTGGIGSGKSAVSDWFVSQGIDVIDADVIAHAITAKNSPVLDELVHAFGEWIVIDGKYNRAAMRDYILKDRNAINTLNNIIHPHIQTHIKDELACSTSLYHILSVPLLVEGMNKSPSLAKLCDRILLVDVPESVQIQRALGRDATKLATHSDPTAYIKTIIAKQATRNERLVVSDDVVDNSGTLDELYEQLQKLHEFYLSLSNR